MDLYKENPRRIASLIVNGNLEIGEVPSIWRSLVQAEIDELEKKAKKPKKPKKPKKAIDDYTVATLKLALDEAGIEYESGMKKAELFALLP